MSSDNTAPTTLIGPLLPAELDELAKLQAAGNQRFIEMGRIFHQLMLKHDEVRQIEEKGQSVLNFVASRLNIPKGAAWAVQPDGTAHFLPGHEPRRG